MQNSITTTNMTRRRFLAAGAATLAVAAIPTAELHATHQVRLSRRRVGVPGLPPALAGFTIAQVSDLHLYERRPHGAAEHALEVLTRVRPDLLVLTGDQWDRRAGAAALPDWLRSLPSSTRVLACVGNHEYSTGMARRAARIHGRGGCELLVNRAATLEVPGGRLQVVGLDDWRHGTQDPEGVARQLDPGLPQLWLLHEPEQVDRFAWPVEARPFLLLAGHTHGGQVRLPLMEPYTPRGSGRYLAGEYATPQGPLYVSRGVGTSGPRVRVQCPPEVPVFELAPA